MFLRRAALATTPLLLLEHPTQARPTLAQPPLTIFAAASLTDALRALAAEWAARGHPAPRLSLAASSTLARQIEQGAGADIFLSADERWMDHLQQRNLIVPETRISPIGNALALITPSDQPAQVELARGTDLLALLGPRGRLAVADPAHVPAGRYAQAALEWTGQWAALSPRLARADNVRAALLLVARGEAPFGIVYSTDAATSGGVALAGLFPPESHPPITYPFAITRHAAASTEARALHAFLAGAQARPVWHRFGFMAPPPGPPAAPGPR